jgi:hypothetical protein
LKGGGGGRVRRGRWRGGSLRWSRRGQLWHLSQRSSRVMGGRGKEESKSQQEGFFFFFSFFFFFKWKQDYRPPTEVIFHLLLSD